MKGQISMIEGYTYDPDEIVIRRGRKHKGGNLHKTKQDTLKKTHPAHCRDSIMDVNMGRIHSQVNFSEVNRKNSSEN